MRLVILLIFLIPLYLSAQTEVRIHPTQVGLFGAGNGDFFRANPATGGGDWTPAAALQGSLFLPPGTEGQTLRNSAGSWVASSTLTNNGSYIGVGTTPNYTLHVNTTTASGQMLSVNSSNLLLTAPMSYINAGSSSDIGAYCYGNNMYWGLGGRTTLMNLKNNALKLSLGNLSGGLEVEGSAAGYTAATIKLISSGSANIRGTGRN